MPRPILVEESLSGPARSPILLSIGAVGLTLMTTVLGGCVSSEKYEAEKARALNFQRLLAQEEKRTGELNAKYQEVQRKVSSLESQNRDVSTEMDALREQLDRTQAELTRAREGGGTRSRALPRGLLRGSHARHRVPARGDRACPSHDLDRRLPPECV